MSKTFYAQKDALGFPIPGTMMSNKTVPSVKNIVEIDISTNVSTPKLHPEKLRYFVRLDKSGNILPNSLIISLTRPKGNNIVEFKIPS